MTSESFIKFRQAVDKLRTIPFRESAHSPTSTLLLIHGESETTSVTDWIEIVGRVTASQRLFGKMRQESLIRIPLHFQFHCYFAYSLIPVVRFFEELHSMVGQKRRNSSQFHLNCELAGGPLTKTLPLPSSSLIACLVPELGEIADVPRVELS